MEDAFKYFKRMYYDLPIHVSQRQLMESIPFIDDYGPDDVLWSSKYIKETTMTDEIKELRKEIERQEIIVNALTEKRRRDAYTFPQPPAWYFTPVDNAAELNAVVLRLEQDKLAGQKFRLKGLEEQERKKTTEGRVDNVLRNAGYSLSKSLITRVVKAAQQ